MAANLGRLLVSANLMLCGRHTICWPLSLVVECGCIPNNLQHELGNLDGVSRRACSTSAGASECSRAVRGIGDMGFVIGAVEVDTIPAAIYHVSMRFSVLFSIPKSLRWVEYVRSDATGAWCRGEGLGIQLCVGARSSIVATEVLRIVATEARLGLPSTTDLFTLSRVTSEHAETRLESGDLSLASRNVVYDKASLGLGGVLITEQLAENLLAMSLQL